MGVHKSKNRIELEKHDIQELLKNHSQAELARFFNVCPATFSRAAYTQLKETTKQKKEKKYRAVEIDIFETDGKQVEFLGTKGAWNELKSTQLYKQVMYGNKNTL